MGRLRPDRGPDGHMNKNSVSGILLIWLVWFPATALHAAESKNCQLKQYGSLDLSGQPNGYLLVPVTIQGSPAFLALNTASPFSSITEAAASRLGLKIRNIPFGVEVYSGTNPIQKVATATGFILGNTQFQSADFLVISNDALGANAATDHVIGILGMNVFANMDVELDVANKKMNLFSQDHCPGQTVYWSKTYDSAPISFGRLGEFYFPMELDGKKIEATLATGEVSTTLSTDATKKLYNFDKNSPDIQTETDGAGRTLAHYRAMNLSGEGIQIINAQITLIDRPQNDSCHLSSRSGAAAYDGCFGIHPLQLGRSLLAKLRVYIATKEKMLYFTRADAVEE